MVDLVWDGPVAHFHVKKHNGSVVPEPLFYFYAMDN